MTSLKDKVANAAAANDLDYQRFLDWTTNDFDVNAIFADADAYAYQGFDPRIILGVMMAIETNLDLLKIDVRSLLTFKIMRGTRVDREKVKTKTDKAGLDKIMKLVAKYGILGYAPKNAKDITISRISAVFPNVEMMILMQLIGKKNWMPAGTVPPNLPRALCFPAGASLIPTDAIDLYNDWLVWDESYNNVIKPKDGSAKSDTNWKVFAELSHRSSFISDGKRGAILRANGLIK